MQRSQYAQLKSLRGQIAQKVAESTGDRPVVGQRVRYRGDEAIVLKVGRGPYDVNAVTVMPVGASLHVDTRVCFLKPL